MIASLLGNAYRYIFAKTMVRNWWDKGFCSICSLSKCISHIYLFSYISVVWTSTKVAKLRNMVLNCSIEVHDIFAIFLAVLMNNEKQSSTGERKFLILGPGPQYLLCTGTCSEVKGQRQMKNSSVERCV